jgi:hypothetical protein
MNIVDVLIDKVNSNDGKVYVYVSKSKITLDKVKQTATERCDFSKTNTKVLLIYPLGIGNVVGDVHGIYYDADGTTKDFLTMFLNTRPDTIINEVDPDTLEIKC